MPLWLYQVSPRSAALIMVLFVEGLALIGLVLVRRLLIPRLHYHDGANDAVSGTVQAIGVFYGITVGLIAVGVWNTNSNAGDLVSREAAAIGALYHDVGGYPSPLRDELRQKLKEYTLFLINDAWPEQKQGRVGNVGSKMLDEFQTRLYTFEPTSPGSVAIHQETLSAYNKLIETRRLRLDAVGSGLSRLMWFVIWVGAVISIGVAYLYRIEDAKIHSILILLMSGFLAIVLFMIVINDKPFYGAVSISSDPYQLILDRVINVTY